MHPARALRVGLGGGGSARPRREAGRPLVFSFSYCAVPPGILAYPPRAWTITHAHQHRRLGMRASGTHLVGSVAPCFPSTVWAVYTGLYSQLQADKEAMGKVERGRNDYSNLQRSGGFGCTVTRIGSPPRRNLPCWPMPQPVTFPPTSHFHLQLASNCRVSSDVGAFCSLAPAFRRAVLNSLCFPLCKA